MAYSMWSDEMEREFYAAQYEDHSKRNHITKAISNLSVAERDLFRQVPTHRMLWLKWRLDISRFELYARAVPHPTPEGTTTDLVIFPSISTINHSCRPNSVFRWNGRYGAVRAIATIAPGEEIVLDRLPEELSWASANQRKQYLEGRFAYSCGCCDCHPITSKQGDQIRRRLRDLRKMLKDYSFIERTPVMSIDDMRSMVQGIGWANEYLALIKQLAWRDMRLVEAHIRLAQARKNSGDLNDAKEHAVLVIVVAANAVGPCLDDVLLLAVEILQRCCLEG